MRVCALEIVSLASQWVKASCHTTQATEFPSRGHLNLHIQIYQIIGDCGGGMAVLLAVFLKYI